MTWTTYHFAYGTSHSIVFDREQVVHKGFDCGILLVQLQMQPLRVVMNIGL